VTNVLSAMVTGRFGALATASPSDGIILGADLADQLRVGVGDSVQLISPKGAMSPLGRDTARKFFTVVGTFRFGFFEFDSGYALVSLPVAQTFLRRGDAFDFMQIHLRNLDDAPHVADLLRAKLGPTYAVQDWAHMNGSLYTALWLEKVAISMAVGLIVLVAALNIVASLILLVMEKTRDIGILKTMGATSKSIRRIFMLQGLVIGCVGTIGGGTLGLLACFVLERYQLIKLPGDVYQIAYLPFIVLPLDLTVVLVAAVLICFLATIYPSRQAGRLDPAEALRYQ
jgi:lipoprotein-releasing system permease protein